MYSPLENNISASTILIGLAVAGLPLYFIGSCLYYAFFHPLSKVPGPKLYSWSQIPYLYHTLRGDWHIVLKDFHDRYGPAVRFTPNEVSFITADSWKQIYGHKTGGDKSFEKEPIHYKIDRQDPHIINANNEDHKRMRRLLSHAFSEKALRNQEDVMKRYTDLFIEKLTAKARDGSIIDIVRWFNFVTFDLIGDLAFGEPFGCLESGCYHPWVRMIFETVKISPFAKLAERLGVASLAGLFVPTELKRSFDEHFQLSKQTVMRRLDTQNTEREDFMSYILRHNDTKKGLTDGEIVENANVLIIAGSETTATLLSGTMFQLLTNRRCYDRLVEEIRSTFKSEEDITINNVNELKYLIAVFSEGFRMYPPVPSSLPRVVPEGGEVVEGHYLPAKTLVSVPQWAAHKCERNFRNPEVFAPERWMDDPAYASDERGVLQPFSVGPRNCIGKNLAYAEMRIILTRLLWKFDLEIQEDSKNWEKQKVFILWEKGDLNVRLKEVQR